MSSDIKLLPFVDRYSGIVRTLERKQDSFDGKGGDVKKYPVSCDVTSRDCENQAIIENLIPNDDKKSVVYWEELSPMTNLGETNSKNYYQKRFRGTARLVVWLNLAKLGETCTSYIEAYAELERVITKKLRVPSGIYQGSRVSIEPKNDVLQDKNIVFGKYTYNSFVNYYLYPFDFFAIDVQFEIEYCLNKGATIPSNPAIDCYNDSGITDCDKIKAQLTTDLLLNCILPLYDFSDIITQDAVSLQQQTDLINWLCSSPSTCPEAITFINNNGFRPCIIQDLDFSIGYDVDFNELTPTQITDLGTRICTPVTPPIPYSFLFDGVNEDFRLNSSALNNLNGFQPYTITMWIYPQKYNTVLWSKTAGGGTGMFWRLTPTGLDMNHRGTASDFVTKSATATIPLNTWSNIGLSFDGSGDVSGVKFWLNGVQILTTTDGLNTFSTSMANVGPLLIGSFAGSVYYQGYISYSRMWGREFNAADILADYNIGDLLETPSYIPDLICNFKAGQDGVFANGIWNVPNVMADNGFASRNMEFADRTTFIP